MWEKGEVMEKRRREERTGRDLPSPCMYCTCLCFLTCARLEEKNVELCKMALFMTPAWFSYIIYALIKCFTTSYSHINVYTSVN